MSSEQERIAQIQAEPAPHAERCVWTLTPQGAAIVGCRAAIIVWQHMSMSAWTHCPYCGKPLTLSPTTTETP